MEKTPVKGLTEAIIRIGQMAEKHMLDAENAEEYAFLFGNLNLASSLAHAIANGKHEIHISLEYDTAMKAYTEAKKQAEEIEEEFHQISMDELFPKLFKALKSVFEEEKPKKPTTNKKSNKKE